VDKFVLVRVYEVLVKQICSLHFVGGYGPAKRDPKPISAVVHSMSPIAAIKNIIFKLPLFLVTRKIIFTVS